MRISILFIFAIVSLCRVAAEGLAFSGSSYRVVDVTPETSTGLNKVYVVYDSQGMTAEFEATTDQVQWEQFGSYGGAYAEQVAPEKNGKKYSLAVGNGDCGYIISDGEKRYYYWVVNYANHKADLQAIDFAEEQDCDRARLQLVGNADKIPFYTINGQGKTVSRDLELTYSTLEFDEASETYIESLRSVTLESIDGTFGVVAPYCNTTFVLQGDRFLKAWGLQQTAQSDTYQAIATEARTYTIQETRENDNEQKVETEALGGSAPIDIQFKSVSTDAAIFQEWQLSSDFEFERIIDRFQQADFNYTFRENGTLYVRFVCNNAAGTCEYVGDTYSIFVGESALLCPNAFSPGASEGVNDEWKVSYKSIVEFECHIFNRWGQQICSFTDPAQGWDGKYKGKYVPAGAYYYVIKAKGSDGKKYDLSGDINIVKSKKNTMAPSVEE